VNRGLIFKSIGETWAGTLCFAAGVFAFQILLAVILPNFQEGLDEILKHLKFVQYMIAALLGTQVSAQMGPKAFEALPWVHPAILALMWAHGIMFCTRLPVAEVERGTIDVLLALPVRRSTVLVSDTVVWILWGCVLAGVALAGNLLGALSSKSDLPIEFLTRMGIAVNFVCVYLCVGGVARVLSSICERRSRAVGAAFAVVIASFVLQTLAMFNEGLAGLSFLGVLEYYRPLQALSGRGWALGDMTTLLLVAGVLWTISVMLFVRRDIRTN